MSDINFTMKSHKDEVMKAMDEDIERALTYIGMEWQNSASLMAPVVTGRLRASINYATETTTGEANTSLLKKDAKPKDDDSIPKATPNKHTVVVGTNVEYAQKIEEGGAKEPQHSHFLRNGFVNHRDKYKKIIAEELKGN